MDKHRLDDMVGGWFVGDFSPSVLRSKDFEVAVKHYSKGDREAQHHHKLADELTLVATGEVRMSGQHYVAGDIVHIHPGEATDFEALTDCMTVVVKAPSVMGDKYEGSADD